VGLQPRPPGLGRWSILPLGGRALSSFSPIGACRGNGAGFGERLGDRQGCLSSLPGFGGIGGRARSRAERRPGDPCIGFRWPDGKTFRRFFPNPTVAKKVSARIEAAVVDGTWRELRMELAGRRPDPITIRQFARAYTALLGETGLRKREGLKLEWRHIEVPKNHYPGRGSKGCASAGAAEQPAGMPWVELGRGGIL
jgi:hypothetical protein